MATSGELRHLSEAFDSNDASEYKLAMQISYSQQHIEVYLVAKKLQGRDLRMDVLYDEGRNKRGGLFQSKVGSKGVLASGRCWL